MRVKNGFLKGEMKIAGGKFIRCLLRQKDGIITKVTFSGDFFMHPEEIIEELEQSLQNVRLNVGDVQKIVHAAFSDTELIGVSPDDFVTLLFKTYEKN